jgi:hypothetical protein
MNISFADIGKTISNFLFRYHIILFSVIVLGGLAAAVFILNSVLEKSDKAADGYTATSNNTTFDTATVDRLDKLHASGDGSTPTINTGSGRQNPFVE